MRTFIFRLSFAAALLLTSGIARPQAAVSTPALGWAFDPGNGTARRIGGLPGAAILQAPVEAGFKIGTMAVSRRQDQLISLSVPDGDLMLVRIKQNGLETIKLDTGLSGQDPIATSSSGDAAVSYKRSSQRMRVMRGLAKAADLAVEFGASLCEDVALSVSDDGEAVAGRCADGSLWLFNSSGEGKLASGPPIKAFVFRAGSREGLALSRDGSLYRVMPSAETILERAGVASADHPAEAAFVATDNPHDLFALGDGTVIRINRVSGETATYHCDCQPSGLFPTGFGDIVRLNDVSQLPIQLFEISTGRFWFVPPDTDAAGDPH